jgi:hypothetical protein
VWLNKAQIHLKYFVNYELPDCLSTVCSNDIFHFLLNVPGDGGVSYRFSCQNSVQFILLVFQLHRHVPSGAVLNE